MTPEQYLQLVDRKPPGLLSSGYNPPSFPGVTAQQQQMLQNQPQASVRPRAQGILGGIMGALQGAGKAIYGDDDITRLRRQNAFQAMTLNPNQTLIAANAAQIKSLQDQQLATANATDIAQYLRGRGKNAEAALVERNPQLASTVLAPEFRGANTYAPQMDPDTGEWMIPRVTASGEVEMIRTGEFGETGAEKAERELQLQLQLQDRQTAMTRGVEAMDAANILTSNVSKYAQALEASESGAESGIVRQYLPALDAQTAQLRRLGSLLGIDIINSATFGALSATELNLALSTGLDLSLSPAELQEDLKKRIAASQKLYNEYMKIARELSSGQVMYSDYINSIPNTPLVPPQDMEGNFLVSPAVWDRMTRDDKVEFLNQGR